MSLDAAFLLLIAGLLGVYCELIWPGRVVAGVLGAAAALTGAYFLFRGPLQMSGLALLSLGALLLFGEIFWGPYLLPGTLGAISLTAGFGLLFPVSHRITPGVAIPVAALFGMVTAWLASIAKRGRRRKWNFS